MEANPGSNALRRYSLLTTPYLRRSSSAFNQPQSSSSSFVSPLFLVNLTQRPLKICSCPCGRMLIASLAQSNLKMSTPVKEATTSSTRKRGLDQDSNT
ncbi:hypothetical protein PILCRDRAFT_195669 [Piloderma croceum F 1598]|uniref:Uncharacterized protein n=1 Tax=Piloderma croceum (strain F 1598) TaxID=765440 RepID=A0A0C3G0N3_PILCF|nr:hypothetical protein PILCRDRAFT_195669 [Piloderma croceum F 1598]